MMLSPSLCARLRCPSCGDRLHPTARTALDDPRGFGRLACHCSVYPVIAGIPVVLRADDGSKNPTVEKAAELIRHGKNDEAFLLMARPSLMGCGRSTRLVDALSSLRGARRLKKAILNVRAQRWNRRARELFHCQQSGRPLCGLHLLDLFFYANQKGYDYFKFRFGQPRHLVSLSLATIIPASDRPVLKIGCGFGHMARGVAAFRPGRQVIGADSLFLPLYAAKYCIAPDAEYVCCNANQSLPFDDDTFAAVMSTNTFHFLTNKLLCRRECERLTGEGGLIIHTALRHTALPAKTPNQALPIEGYDSLFAGMPHRILSDQEILKRYLAGLGPAMSNQPAGAHLSLEPTVSLVAARKDALLTDHGPFNEWPHAKSRLGINPLYHVDVREADGSVHLTRHFPSAFYEEENQACTEYLPREAVLSCSAFKDMCKGIRTAEMETLVQQIVLLDLPEHYASTDATSEREGRRATHDRHRD